MTNNNLEAMRAAADELAREAHTSEQRGQRMTSVRTSCASLAARYVAHLAARSAENKESAAPSVPGGESESVGTPEFKRKLFAWLGANEGKPSQAAYDDLISHINAHVARQVQAARDQALEEAAEACMRATPDRAHVRRIGEAAHYSACRDAIHALRSPQEAASTAQEKTQ